MANTAYAAYLRTRPRWPYIVITVRATRDTLIKTVPTRAAAMAARCDGRGNRLPTRASRFLFRGRDCSRGVRIA